MTSERAPVVVLVEPSEPGNIGTAARAVANFGFDRLLLVDPPELDPDGEAYGFAGQARDDVLPAAETVTFEAVTSSYHTVAFTAIPNEDATSHVRFPYTTPTSLAEDLTGVDTDVALVFGPERTGLTNDQLVRLDRVCCIPAAADYPTLNLGQAVTVALYALRSLAPAESQLPPLEHHRADEAAIDRLYDHFDAFLGAINHPVEKRAKANRLIRRLIGRAHPTDREVVTLTGVFRRGAQFADPPGESGEDAADGSSSRAE